MSLNDSSSLILIVGAIAILAFVVHGLWFSGRSINRKLVKGSKEDQEIALSNADWAARDTMLIASRGTPSAARTSSCSALTCVNA